MEVRIVPAADVGATPDAAATPSPSVQRHLDGLIAVITMQHRPYNLLDPRLTRELVDALGWATGSGARAVLLNSALRHFSAGAELNGMLEAAERGNGVLDWPIREVLTAFEECPLPIVAAVHGTCVGGGFELALASDLIIAADSAKIGSVEVAVGLHPLMGGIQRVAQRAGAARAKEMALLGRRYDARTLERWNVINRVVPDEQLPAAADALARELAQGPTVAHRATKAVLNVAVNEGVRAADQAMSRHQEAIFRSADFRAGVAAFNNPAPGGPTFEGR